MEGGGCGLWHFYHKQKNWPCRWNFLAQCQFFVMVVFNICFCYSRRNHVFKMTHFNFTAISFKWKFLAYNLSSLLKRSITSDLRMKKLRICLCQLNYYKLWLANEVKISGLTLAVGENLWFTLSKPIVIQNAYIISIVFRFKQFCSHFSCKVFGKVKSSYNP